MYRATRDFISARQKHSEFKLQTPTVKRIGGGESNKCFQNATTFVEKGKAEGIKYIALSGWLVQPYDEVRNCTAIIQHWWNGDSQGSQFDTTPLINDGAEYVLDFSIYEFSRVKFNEIKSNVATSLLYQNGNFELLADTESMLFLPLHELKTEAFFKYES